MVTRVKSILSLTGNGAKDWFYQRLSAIILAVYTLFLVAYFFGHSPVVYGAWLDLFSHTSMKIFTLLAVLSLMLHAWVGMWTVLTDYVHHSVTRAVILTLVFLALLVCVIWSIEILWR